VEVSDPYDSAYSSYFVVAFVDDVSAVLAVVNAFVVLDIVDAYTACFDSHLLKCLTFDLDNLEEEVPFGHC
jgi:hypothetical protein